MDEDNDCPRCHVSVTTDDGCEPTKFCHHCAQALLIEARMALECALDYTDKMAPEDAKAVRDTYDAIS